MDLEICEESKNDSHSASSNCTTDKSYGRKKYSTSRYHPDYLKYGFVCARSGKNDPPLPLCVVCNKKLSNKSLKPSLLKRHFCALHDDLADKPIKYFEQLKSRLKGQRKKIEDLSRKDVVILRQSFINAMNIAKNPLAFENRIKPLHLDILRKMFADEPPKNIIRRPNIYQKIRQPVHLMALDIEEQLCAQLKNSGKFALQLGAWSNVASESIILGFVRFVNENEIAEELFCSRSLANPTTGADMFRVLDAKMMKHKLLWKNVVGVCTDGAAAEPMREIATTISHLSDEDFITTHCIMRCEAFISAKMSTELNQTLQDAVKMVNFVKSNPDELVFLSVLRTKMGQEYFKLLSCTDKCWLMRGDVMSHFYRHLRGELKIFMAKNKQTQHLKMIENDRWYAKLAYLADVLNVFYGFNKNHSMHCIAQLNQFEALQKKMRQWKSKVAVKNFDGFPLVSKLLLCNKQLMEYMQPIVSAHLDNVVAEIRKNYFISKEDPRLHHSWIVNPFGNANEPNILTATENAQRLSKLFTFSNILLFCAHQIDTFLSK